MRTVTLTRNQLWEQVGWRGQSGCRSERGSFAPVWELIENERPIIDEAEVDDARP